MRRVKVIGAGSIGNHLSNAARRLGWDVTLVDRDAAALARTRDQLYPTRYGSWDPEIKLVTSDEAPKGGFDYILVGTPPDVHMPVALAALDEEPKAILVEKPVCMPDLSGADSLWRRSNEMGVRVFVGYDHVVGKACQTATDVITSGALGTVETLDVEFREHWGGIFAAHFWLDGPADSYLGHWKRGGGASGEHSHAANLWQHFAHQAGGGRVTEVSAEMSFVKDTSVDYDRLCLMTLRTETGLLGRVVQDVVTHPPRKMGRIQGDSGFVEWHCGYEPGADAVIVGSKTASADVQKFHKTRPDDFIQELTHLEQVLAGTEPESPISLERGLDTMLVVAAAHRSVAEQRTVRIRYDRGYTAEALTV